jgi:phosphoribosylformimino-5-aminoimidazole carboxamide ribotide isomerase
MVPIPAIDLKGGRVVRLFQGDFDKEVVYPQKAEEMARRFESEGAQRIHVVDLDGALKGEPKNQALIENILRSVKVPVEVGGGIRDLKQAERYLTMGVRWVILGTKPSLDTGFLREALSTLGERAIIGIDARDGRVATDGWTNVLSLKALDLAERVEALGGKTVIYTDISRDGALKGPNLKQIDEFCGVLRLDVIASGGVSDLKDLKALGALKKTNLAGVVIGKALYENKFSLNEAIRACLPSE